MKDISRGINHIGLTVPDIEEATEFSKRFRWENCI